MRYAISSITAVFVTLLLFILIQYLIARKVEKETRLVYRPIDVYYAKRPDPEPPQQKKLMAKVFEENTNKPILRERLFDPKLPALNLPDVDINMDPLKLAQNISGVLNSLGAGIIVKGAEGLSSGNSHGLADGKGPGQFELKGSAAYRDIVIIPHGTMMPPYPDLAAREKIEGWVTVEFTILENGCVQDVVVLDAEPKGVFEETTVKTVYQWKYRALPVSVRASQYIEFTLDQLDFYHGSGPNEE